MVFGGAYLWFAGRTVGLPLWSVWLSLAKADSPSQHKRLRHPDRKQFGKKGAAYLKYILPLFPTLPTVNCRPSRPSEGTSHLSASEAFLQRVVDTSPCILRSAAGKIGLVGTALKVVFLIAGLSELESLGVLALDLGDTLLPATTFLGEPLGETEVRS